MRADRVALGAKAEELAFDRVEVERRVEAFAKDLRRATSISRWRGPRRSTGVSFMPSGIQRFVTQGLPRARPNAAPIWRQAMPCAIQNSRIARSGWDSVKLSAAFGCEKNVWLKSSPMPSDLRPVDPAAKVLGRDRVAIDAPAAELAVRRVQIEAMPAGNER